MRINIIGFRSHQSSEYLVTDSTITLLSGRSGAGKSTVLQAIYWCLYGGMKFVYPHTGKGPCEVTVEFGQLIISRKKRPELLSVSSQEGLFEGDEAQAVVNSLFGGKDLWVTTSYIQQGHRCGLLSGSNSVRLDVLNRLSFQSSDPDAVVNELEKQLSIIQQQLTLESNTFSQSVVAYTDQNKKKSFSTSQDRTEFQLKSFREEMGILGERQRSLTLAVTEQKKLQAVRDNLLSNYAKLGESLLVVPIVRESEIRELEEKILQLERLRSEWDRYTIQQIELSKIQGELEKFVGNVDLSAELVTRDLIWETQRKEDTHTKNSKLVTQLGLEYSSSIISTRMGVISERLSQLYSDKQQLLSITQTTNTLRMLEQQFGRNESLLSKARFDILQIGTIPEPLISGDEFLQLQESCILMEKKCLSLKQGMATLSCPHCNQGLRYNNGQLIPTSHPVCVDDYKKAEEELSNIRAMVRDYQTKAQHISQLRSKLDTLNHQAATLEVQKEQLQNQIAIVQSQLPSVGNLGNDRKISIEAEIQTLQREHQTLSSVCVVELPEISSAKLAILQQYQSLCRKRDELISHQPIDDPNLSNLSSYKLQLLELRERFYRRNSIQTQMNNIKENIDAIILDLGVEKELHVVLERTQQVEKELREGEYARQMISWHEQLLQKEAEVQELHSHLEALTSLRAMAIQVECTLLEETVDSINVAMEEILTQIFEDPIMVRLSLYRVLKSTKRTKPQVNLSIGYRGGEYDNINQLSGGEADRVSLALVIALNMVSGSPILLLDECLSSLDGTYRETCIQALKILTRRGKTLLCINHEDVEGLYDEVISF